LVDCSGVEPPTLAFTQSQPINFKSGGE